MAFNLRNIKIEGICHMQATVCVWKCEAMLRDVCMAKVLYKYRFGSYILVYLCMCVFAREPFCQLPFFTIL